MWYKLLINGYVWWTNQLYYSPDIKLSETKGGELTEGHLSYNEKQQIRSQLYDYQTLGYNRKISHLSQD